MSEAIPPHLYRGDLQVWKDRKEELGDVVYERVKIKGEVSHCDSHQLHAIIPNPPSQGLYIFLSETAVCMREWMSGGQGHPVTREDAQSDSVLHFLPRLFLLVAP